MPYNLSLITLTYDLPYRFDLGGALGGGLHKLDHGGFGAYDVAQLHKHALYVSVVLGHNVIFHLHCLVDKEDFALLHSLTVLDIERHDAATHGSGHHVAGDRFGHEELFLSGFGLRLGSLFLLILSLALLAEETVGHGGKELKEQHFLDVGSELAVAELGEHGILGPNY